MKRLVFLFGVFALTLLALPAIGTAQNYERDRDRDSREDKRELKLSVQRVDRLSGQLKNDMDHALDRSRLDGREREDRINNLVSEFHSAAARFRDKFDGGHFRRAQNEADQMLTLGWRLDEMVSRHELGDRVESKWSQIRSDLQAIQDAYGEPAGDRDRVRD